jgi:hypothetical protein
MYCNSNEVGGVMWKVVIGACALSLVSSGVMAEKVSPKTIPSDNASGDMCYGLKPVKDMPDFSSWLKEKHVEATDSNEWKLRQVYNERVAQKHINSGKRVFVFRPHKYKWYLYENGELIEDGVANGGKAYCSDIKRGCRTPGGVFKIYSKRGAGCRSSKFPINKNKPRARMPYCMFLKRVGGSATGYAIHGSKYIHPSRHGSHGCVRVKTPDARMLSNDYLGIGTTVVITRY